MRKFVLVLSIMLCLCGVCFAATENVTALINRKVKVSYDGALQEFSNANGVRVYPLTYQGTTYLPVRAVSSLFGTEIRWDGDTNSVYLGEGDLDEGAAKTIYEYDPGENEDATVLLNEDVLIYFLGDPQMFFDANGEEVFPLSYEGTTYLPVRAVSNLFGLFIDWDADNYEVVITTEYDFSGYTGEGELREIDGNEVAQFVEYSYDDNGREVFYFYDEDWEVTSYYFVGEDEIEYIQISGKTPGEYETGEVEEAEGEEEATEGDEVITEEDETVTEN